MSKHTCKNVKQCQHTAPFTLFQKRPLVPHTLVPRSLSITESTVLLAFRNCRNHIHHLMELFLHLTKEETDVNCFIYIMKKLFKCFN